MEGVLIKVSEGEGSPVPGLPVMWRAAQGQSAPEW